MGTLPLREPGDLPCGRPPAGGLVQTRRRWGGGRIASMRTSTLTPTLVSGTAGTVVAAALLGALFVYVTGFLPVQAMHAAAHDTRHAIMAPCH